MSDIKETHQPPHAPQTCTPPTDAKPGYKKTKLGWIPEEWEVKRLEDISSHFKSGFGITSKEIFDKGRFPVYGGNGLRGYANRSTHEGQYVLIGRQGALCGNIQFVQGQVYISEHAIAVQVDNQNHLLFWRYKLEYKNLNRLSESSAQPGLSVAKLLRLRTVVPPLPEQQKIAAILSTWDKAINTLQQLITQKQKRKKGLMQQLLSGKKRFLEFVKSEEFKKTKLGRIPEEWEFKSISNLGKVVTGSTPSTKKPEYYDGDFLFVSPSDIKGDKLINTTEKTLSIEGFQTGRKVAAGSALFVSIGSTIGKTGVAGTELITNQQINAVVPNNHSDGEFIYYQLNFQKGRIKRIAGHQAVPILNKSTFSKIQIFSPPLPEQQKIAAVLSTADAEIEKLQNQLQKLQQQKKGLMQKLLTGEVRVELETN